LKLNPKEIDRTEYTLKTKELKIFNKKGHLVFKTICSWEYFCEVCEKLSLKEKE